MRNPDHETSSPRHPGQAAPTHTRGWRRKTNPDRPVRSGSRRA